MDNIICCLILGDQGYNFWFCKYCTHTGNCNIFFEFQPTFAHLIQIHFHGTCHHFQKSSGSCRTFVIHNKVCNCTVLIQSDHLAVLSANINNSTDFRIQEMRTSCMTGDLCDTLITIFNSCTSVSGSNQRINIFSLQSGLLQCFCQGTVCSDSSPCSCRQDNTGHNLMIFI